MRMDSIAVGRDVAVSLPSMCLSLLSQDELKELKQLAGSKIDQGNRMLSMDLVPRDENGSPIDPKTAGVMHLYRAVSGHTQPSIHCPCSTHTYMHIQWACMYMYVSINMGMYCVAIVTTELCTYMYVCR